MATNYPVAPASGSFTNFKGEARINIQRLRRALFHRWLCPDNIRLFNPHAMLFDLGGTAKSRNFAHVRAHRRRVYGSLAFGVSQVHWLVMIFNIPILLR
jgi:hypothetical protein